MMIWARSRFGSAMLALTLALVTGPVMAQAQQKVLRVGPQGEVKVFDPHQSQVNLTSMHAALVYDTLFSWDADMVARPQMVERWTVSDDKLLYTFTLRPGLKFSDGSPVTTRDAIATLKRLFLHDSQIQSLAQRVATLESIDDKTFTLPPQGTVPLRRVSAWRQQRHRRRHHAREGGNDGPLHPDHRDHRIGAIPFRQIRVSTRREACL
jgi:peptide/nickel transport system substrate-binding protein